MSDILAMMETLRHVDAFLTEVSDQATDRVQKLEEIQDKIKTDPTFQVTAEDVKDLHEQLEASRIRALEAKYILGEFRKRFNK